MTRNPPAVSSVNTGKEFKTRVSGIENGNVTLSYAHSKHVTIQLLLPPQLLVDSGLSVSSIKIGDEFKAAVVVRTSFSPSCCEAFLAGCSFEVVSVRRQVEPFSTAGMDVETGIVTKPKSDGEDAVVTCRQGGEVRNFRISSATQCFQAQQDPTERRAILDRLKPGTPVNLWIDPSNKDIVQQYSVIFK